jgi:hypothetical protein
MNRSVVEVYCELERYFPPESALLGKEPDPKEYKKVELFQRWKSICCTTHMTEACHSCEHLRINWSEFHAR